MQGPISRVQPILARAGRAALVVGALAAVALGAASDARGEPSATLVVDPPGDVHHSSSFATGSFSLANTSTAGETITRFRVDMSTAFLPDLVFDPFGIAGNDLGKDFTVDSDDGVGLVGHTWLSPHDAGFDALELTFTDFDPGETITFSMDGEPTTIKGAIAPGPNQTGKISGFEMTGSRVEVDFDDASALVGDPFGIPGSLDGAEVTLRAGAPPAPTVRVLGQPSPSTTTSTAHTVRVTGTPGAEVRLLQVESGLFLHSIPSYGFDVDPWETNTSLAVVEHQTTLDGAGVADVPVVLSATSSQAGTWHFVAAELDASGVPGRTSDAALLRYLPPGPEVLRLNLAAREPYVGGADFPGYWNADQGEDGVCTPNGVGRYETTNPIHGTVDDFIFQRQTFGYAFDCAVDNGPLVPGTYQVNLLFAEIRNGPGCEVPNPIQESIFDIVLEGVTVETAFHPFGEAGCAASTTDPTGGVIVRSFDVDVLDGTLDILLPVVSSHATLSGIELVGPLLSCADGIDNDGDGLVDAADPGCDDAQDHSERSAAACDDGIDNDADGFTDYPLDPGCGFAASETESPACDDGVDNDGDGFVDLADPECSSPLDAREAFGRSCGLGGELALLLTGLALLRRARRRG